jgi:hypothetical protein
MQNIVPPKHRLTSNGLHGVISQKIEIFITTAVRTSNPTLIIKFNFYREYRDVGQIYTHRLLYCIANKGQAYVYYNTECKKTFQLLITS